MPREVTHDATRPLFLSTDDVDPEKGDIAVCRCGLSDDRPFCDGSHRAIEGEGDGVYRYVDGERKRVARVEFADGDELVFDGDDDADDVADGDDGREI